MPRTADVTVRVPGPLRAYCGNVAELPVSAASVREVLQELERTFPAVYSGVCDETGTVRRHVNLFVNATHVRDREGLETVLNAGDVLTILPAVSGG